MIRSHGYSEAVVTPVLVQAYMPTVQCIITAYNEAIGEKVGRSADEVISELGSDYVTNLSREREALRAENERLRGALQEIVDRADRDDLFPAPPFAWRRKAWIDGVMTARRVDADIARAALHPQEGT